jgi:hypothetical protein
MFENMADTEINPGDMGYVWIKVQGSHYKLNLGIHQNQKVATIMVSRSVRRQRGLFRNLLKRLKVFQL